MRRFLEVSDLYQETTSKNILIPVDSICFIQGFGDNGSIIHFKAEPEGSIIPVHTNELLHNIKYKLKKQ